MEESSRALRAHRRRLARELHPDVGGDADAFIDAMARHPRIASPGEATDRPAQDTIRRTAAPAPTAPANVQFTGTLRRTAAASLRKAVDAGRARLPRGWPGARRYIPL